VNARGIRILADDLTGALDTAAAFAGPVPVFIDRPPGARHCGNDNAVAVLATATRDQPVEDLPSCLQTALPWLRAGTVAFKKVDSLLRGNTFAETAWIARHAPFELTIFAPAFPAQGRITADDRQWIATPGGDRQAVSPPLREMFATLARRACTTLDTPDREHCDTWIPEALTDADLDAVVAAGQQKAAATRLWCGSAGLAQALARRWNLAPASDTAPPLPGDDGPTVLISASFQPILREQWARLYAMRETPAVARNADDEQIAVALQYARAGARGVWLDLSPSEQNPPGIAAQRLTAHATRIVDALPRPGQLVVIGGDTLLALCRASAATALLAHPSVRPGWGCARLIGGTWDGVPCYSRSGAFGAPDDLVEMIRLLDGSQTP
jgi:uncharacterized protein YgbK (DUF1537 family)